MHTRLCMELNYTLPACLLTNTSLKTIATPRAVLCTDYSFAHCGRHVVAIFTRIPADTAKVVSTTAGVIGPCNDANVWTHYRYKDNV